MTAPAVPIITFFVPSDKQLVVYYIPSITGTKTYNLFYSTNGGVNWWQYNLNITSPLTITTNSINGLPLENGKNYSIQLVTVTGANPYTNTPSNTVIMSPTTSYKFTPTRTQYAFDLSGIKYRSRADTLKLQRQWETFEKVENFNNVIFQRLSLGIRNEGYYQYSTSEEQNDYRAGQQSHIARYPSLPPAIFDSISLQQVPTVTPLTDVPICSMSMTRGVVFSTSMTASDYSAQQSDLSIYKYVSTYNSQHKYQYLFPSNEEKMAYYRAERIVLGGM